MIQHIPLDAIDETALTRDRTAMGEAELAELRLSIARSGLRMPIEVFPLAEPEEPLRFGLISGFRRLAAVRALSELTGDPRYATIPALVREPATLADALTEMVEENAVRADLSPWERGRIALLARDQGLFPTIEEAVDRLYPATPAVKKSRYRSLARLVEALEGELTDPELLSQRQALRLAGAVRDGYAPLMRTALSESTFTDPASQWRTLLPILQETERFAEEETEPGPASSTRPGRPRRTLTPRPGLTIRREMTKGGYLLRFTGRDATSALLDLVMDEIERMFAPE